MVNTAALTVASLSGRFLLLVIFLYGVDADEAVLSMNMHYWVFVILPFFRLLFPIHPSRVLRSVN